MAGQLTFTNGPDFHGERACTMRATISLPVPLSPWIRTGTLAPATLPRRSRNEFMASDEPKTTASGGISPIDWTRELTEFVAVLDIPRCGTPCSHSECTPGTKPGRG